MESYEDYKAEYQSRYWEKKNAERAARLKYEKLTYRLFRYASFPIALFAFVVILDGLFPRDIYSEVVENGWQVSSRGRRGSTLHSYMETSSFIVEVPHQAHLKYPYYEKGKPKMNIGVTPIFNIAVQGDYEWNGTRYSFELPNTIHTVFLPLPWMMLLMALYICYARDYDKYSYSLVFIPAILLGIVLLTMSKN